MWKFLTGLTLIFLALMISSCSTQPSVDATKEEETSKPVLVFTPVHTEATIESSTLRAPTVTSNPTAVPSPLTSSTPSPEPTLTAMPSPSSIPAQHSLAAYTIPAYRTRDFPGGPIQIKQVLEQNREFTRYYIAYPSGDLTITGVMHIPNTQGPLPVLILLHGYFERDQYYPGADTWQAASYFARNVYLVLAPDLRSWGESDPGLSIFHMGLTADVLNLISSLSTIPEADPSRIGLWGHSMGGGIATKILTIDDRVQGAVLYAPNSADDTDLIARWGPGCLPDQSQAAGDLCNPGEYIPADTATELITSYLFAASDHDFLQQVAPLYHLDKIEAPIQIHIGEADGSHLTHTPPEWSGKLSDALQDAGKEVTTFTYSGQGHYFSGESWISLLARSLELFDQQLKSSE